MRLAVVNFYTNSNDFKAVVADVFLGCHLGQREIFVIVRFKVKGDKVHRFVPVGVP
jgi:hypothetical protein